MNEWYGELPGHWEVQRIKVLFSLRDERNFEPLSDVCLLSLYTAIGVKPNKEIERKTGNRAVTADNYKKVYVNDIVVNIILCWQGAVGVSKWDGVTSPAYDVYKAKSDTVNVDYFNYLFRLPHFSGECYKAGRGIMAMRWRTYSDQFTAITVPLPPRSEQDQIVRYLDWKISQINRLINAKRRQIGLLQEKKRAVVNEAVTRGGEGWQERKIKHIFSIKNGATPESGKSEYWDGDIKWITPVDLSKVKTYVDSSLRTITELGYSSCATTLLPANSLVLATRAPIGNVRICGDSLCTNQGCKGLVPLDRDVNAKFYYYLLSAKETQLQALGDGTTFSELSTIKLANVHMLCPSHDEQQAIVTHLDGQCERIDKLISKVNAEITLLHEYRTRLISDVVTGKVDVHGAVVPEHEAVEEAADAEEITDTEIEGDEN